MIRHLAAVFRHPGVGTCAAKTVAYFVGLAMRVLMRLLSLLAPVKTEEEDAEKNDESTNTKTDTKPYAESSTL